MFRDTIGEQIKGFIVKTFPLARKGNLGIGDPLLGGGIIDSLGVLNLVGYIEGEFKVHITDDDLVPENFQTIEYLAAFVRAKQHIIRSDGHDDIGAPRSA